MKRILPLIALIGLSFLSACSSEDNPTDVTLQPPLTQGRFVKATINGAEVTFDETTVVKQNLVENGEPYTDLIVTANKKNDASAKIIFKLQYLQPGPDTCYYFLYNQGDSEFDIESGNSFAIDVTENSANNIKGTFNGTLHDFEGNAVEMNGNFDITF